MARGSRSELARLERRAAELAEELNSQKEQLAHLENEWEARQQPPDEAQVSILPSGSAVGFDPVFVECASGSVIIHQGDSPPRIRTADLAQDDSSSGCCPSWLPRQGSGLCF
jgi:hypothetical protein